jgi:endonuclease/exonuclease/phosphatase (EEP) superfamily protein YafD
LQEVLKDAARYPADTPVVVAGDINTKYPHLIAEVAKLMRDSGYQSAFGDKHVRTHVIVGDPDWIFARGPVRLSDAKVHREMPGSDHWARLAEERVAGR